MKVTIITVCLNAEISISKTIESVICQTYKDVEYIILDGGSTDNTRNIIKKYDDYATIYSEKDNGISHAFNKGVLRSKGDVILFLNAGDYFISNTVIEEYISDYNHEKAEIIFYKAHVKDNIYIPNNKYNDNAYDIWNSSMLPHQASFIKREVFEQVGLFNPYLRIRMDYDFFARAKIIGLQYRYIPKSIVEYDTGGVSMSKCNRIQYIREQLAINRFLNIHTKLSIYAQLIKRYMEKIFYSD